MQSSQYEPTTAETTLQMYREGKQYLKEAVNAAATGVLFGFGGVFIFPSAARIGLERLDRYAKNHRMPVLEIGLDKILLGCIGAAAMIAYVNPRLAYYAMHYNPKTLLIPLATNIASGIYELHRFAKRRLIEQHNKNLNNVIEGRFNLKSP